MWIGATFVSVILPQCSYYLETAVENMLKYIFQFHKKTTNISYEPVLENSHNSKAGLKKTIGNVFAIHMPAYIYLFS